MTIQACFVPVKTVSEANSHEHWRKRQRRAKAQRAAAALCASYLQRPSGQLVVSMCRYGKRKLDSDNLHGSLKHVRDGIADWLGVDDGDESLVRWECYQKSPCKELGVMVVVEQRVMPVLASGVAVMAAYDVAWRKAEYEALERHKVTVPAPKRAPKRRRKAA
jgi:hypothetical protein